MLSTSTDITSKEIGKSAIWLTRLVSFGSAHRIEALVHTPGKLRGRLQHVVVATTNLPAITDFYHRKLDLAI